ncbi:hypothetical protein D3C85_1935100 [compost metagenome]
MMVFAAAALLMHAQDALQIKRYPHLHEHVAAVGRFVINAQPRADAMTLSRLHGEHSVFNAVVGI